jgi:hypothetical protein
MFDNLFKLKNNVRTRIRVFLKTKNMDKKHSTFNFVGCTPNQLKEHIENKFNGGMS